MTAEFMLHYLKINEWNSNGIIWFIVVIHYFTTYVNLLLTFVHVTHGRTDII